MRIVHSVCFTTMREILELKREKLENVTHSVVYIYKYICIYIHGRV